MTASDSRTVAARAIPLLDLTDLSDTCTAPRIDALCRDARAGAVAAVCLWPQFVPQAMQALTGTGIRIATVINFPDGDEDAARTADDAAEVCRDGAGEIDLVLPYRAVLRGEERVARAVIAAVRETCPDTLLKVILETGELRDPGVIRAAADLALAEGADFLKTSTGKSPVSATPEAARILLDAVRASGRPAGVKISGGLRTVADAATYLALADRAMGPEWARPATFRLGASSLYGALIDARDA